MEASHSGGGESNRSRRELPVLMQLDPALGGKMVCRCGCNRSDNELEVDVDVDAGWIPEAVQRSRLRSSAVMAPGNNGVTLGIVNRLLEESA